MKILPFSKIRSLILILAIIIFSAGVGYRLGERKTTVTISAENRVIVNQTPPSGESIDFGLFWDVWARLGRSYIDRATLDPQKMVWGAITGMVNSLGDPYTAFLPPKENKEFKEDLGGQFEGIGAQLGIKETQIVVIAPLKGSPAEKAGIQAGDFILKVDEADTVGWTVTEAVNKIRGPRGTTVKLSILHDGGTKPVDISIVRNTITVASVESWMKTPQEITEISGIPYRGSNGTIAYIRLSRFGDHSNEDFLAAVESIAKNNLVKGLVLDLRNNPGGYLDGSVFIASEFIKDGVVVSQVNSDGTRQEYPVVRRGKLLTMSLVVLINKGSASASEIVAGALRDHKRATLVGETTFGKGSVQTPEDLPDGSSIHITTGRWHLPNGDSISQKGVIPDVLVPMEAYDATGDAQLAKAIELLLK